MAADDVRSTLILSASEVKQLLSMGEVIKAVEGAFRACGEGMLEMTPKSYVKAGDGDFRAMPACMADAASLKWVNSHPVNRTRGLPTVMAVLIYSDPRTGFPLAVMDATEITAFRTGATAAVASRYLARKDSRTLGLVGAGKQAHSQLLAHMEVFDLELVRVYDVRAEATERFVASFPQVDVQGCSLEDTMSSDIVCTLTPAREPIIRRDWVLSGTHINAVGADAKGKQELDPAILNDAIVVVDDLHQAASGGEINVALAEGLFTVEQVHGTLAQIVTGQKEGRVSEDAITVLDSTGIALEDLAAARLVYQKACTAGRGLAVELVSLS